MLKKLNKPLKFASTLIVSIFLTLGFSISLQSLLAAWTTPIDNPPQNNINNLLVGGDIGASGDIAAVGNILGNNIIAGGNIGGANLCINADCRNVWPSGGTYTAGTGLSLSSGTFSVNTTAIQNRVSGSCTAGSSIRVINSNGTVTCEADDSGGSGTVTSVATNNGITGGTITTSGTIGLDTGLISSCTNSTSNKIYWNGARLACGTDQSGAGGVTGSGITNYLTKWNSTTGLTRSLIQEAASGLYINQSLYGQYSVFSGITVGTTGISSGGNIGSSGMISAGGNIVSSGNISANGNITTAGGRVTGQSGYFLQLQSDGNLVWYNSNGTPRWASSWTISSPSSHRNCEFVDAAQAAVCPPGKFLVAMDRTACTHIPGKTGGACYAKCCTAW